jgi:hypothetical protein
LSSSEYPSGYSTDLPVDYLSSEWVMSQRRVSPVVELSPLSLWTCLPFIPMARFYMYAAPNMGKTHLQPLHKFLGLAPLYPGSGEMCKMLLNISDIKVLLVNEYF